MIDGENPRNEIIREVARMGLINGLSFLFFNHEVHGGFHCGRGKLILLIKPSRIV
jgi:hypothetical protein